MGGKTNTPAQTGDEYILFNKFSVLIQTCFCELEISYADLKTHLKMQNAMNW